MILSCRNVGKSFGAEEILTGVSFHIEENEKVAVVGDNGAGKTTLLRLLTGELTPDAGEVTVSGGATIGILKQNADEDSHRSVHEEVLYAREDLLKMEEDLRRMEEEMQGLSAENLEKHMDAYHRLSDVFAAKGGLVFRSEAVGVLKGLGFREEEFDRPMRELSGGEKTRVCLARLLVADIRILLLDEPTNHLDVEALSWLENFLQSYEGTVVLVSHDRYFMDKVATKVVEIAHHEAQVYFGNYSHYIKEKALRRESEERAYENERRRMKHEEEVIAKLKSFNREKSVKRAESREKMLDRMKENALSRPEEEENRMHLTITPHTESGKDVLTVTDAAKAFGEKTLFDGISFEIKRGERVALVGANGVGKTTLLKMICGLTEGDGGQIVPGANVFVGYYDQEHRQLNEDNTLFDEIGEAYPRLTQTQIRNHLAAFLFKEEDVFKKVANLSGGEKGRLALAKLMLSNANFLILDEPTNHLDIVSKEILEEALGHYTGTVFYVSHDRYFINRTATRVLELTADGLTSYLGNYDDYREKKEQLMAAGLIKETGAKTQESAGQNAAGQNAAETPAPGKSAGAVDWQEQKRQGAQKRKIENDIRRTEEEIERLEKELEEQNQKLEDPAIATNSVKLQEVTGKIGELEAALQKAYDKWEELSLL